MGNSQIDILELSKVVIKYQNALGASISHLKLQKLLY